MLEVINLVKDFSCIRAVNNVSFNLSAKTITAVIGPNGAGKTTLYHLISGELQPTSGSVKLNGRELVGLSPHKIVKAGIGRSFQITSVFPSLTVQQNIRAAVIARGDRQFNFWQNLQSDISLKQTVSEVMSLVGIENLATTPLQHLSHGDRSLVEIAIVLAVKPLLILLDEPTAGMSQSETNRIVELIRYLQQEMGCTFLITEHDMEVVFNLAELIIVLHQGSILAVGNSEEIKNHPDVRRAYLGV
ncbi:MAG: ABC transporter ATP-binding protein [Okeania sp. SIO2F4]|uniref:ABC transporter ATP-binding protein n=1 Tax=Okeania sp. SIO2F4 TaxID=2607790 RepID=UPI00142A9E7E|nr:ABC transporter ATP-binding protein [Okeania sp. SIO2F4]NES01618.1 ABC transporter ATP-binding protein [Okeania sp. SIO2F4]